VYADFVVDTGTFVRLTALPRTTQAPVVRQDGVETNAPGVSAEHAFVVGTNARLHCAFEGTQLVQLEGGNAGVVHGASHGVRQEGVFAVDGGEPAILQRSTAADADGVGFGA